jgi:hypothetical protein
MVPLQNFATGVIAEVIRRQPASPGRTTFAWTVAVGPALARSATVTLVADVLKIRVRDPRWATEIERAADTILNRMQHLLGAASVSRIEVLR